MPDADVERARRDLGRVLRVLSAPPTDHERTMERLGRLAAECRAKVDRHHGADLVTQLDVVLRHLPEAERGWVERHTAALERIHDARA